MARLGKQRVEAWQCLNGLALGEAYGWWHHPCTQMWVGYDDALAHYYNLSLQVFEEHGGRNDKLWYMPTGDIILPDWFGDERLHSRHRSQLLGKARDHYSQFGWDEDPGLDYWWPGRGYYDRETQSYYGNDQT